MLIDDIKAIAKDGADLTGIEGQLKALNPISGLQTKEQAWELIKENPMLMSAFDSEVSTRVNHGVENFKSGKMQDEWKKREAELRASLNPEESEADKANRELREEIEQMKNERNLSKLQDELSMKAKEMEFDPIKARDFAVYGEKALDKLNDFAAWQNEIIESKLSTELKDKYNKKPPTRSANPSTVQMSRSEYNEMSPYEQRSFTVDQKGVVVDE